jgi:hypothetical protein
VFDHWRWYAAQAIGYLIILVPLDAIWGEIVAFQALENRKASSSASSTVMQAVVVLTIAIAVALALRFRATLIEEKKRARQEGTGQTKT